ncbi:MAG: hypothetical protein ABI359_15235 [Ginsengibacter sp.]
MANEFSLTTLAQICSKGKAALAYVVGWVDIFSKRKAEDIFTPVQETITMEKNADY